MHTVQYSSEPQFMLKGVAACDLFCFTCTEGHDPFLLGMSGEVCVVNEIQSAGDGFKMGIFVIVLISELSDPMQRGVVGKQKARFLCKFEVPELVHKNAHLMRGFFHDVPCKTCICKGDFGARGFCEKSDFTEHLLKCCFFCRGEGASDIGVEVGLRGQR